MKHFFVILISITCIISSCQSEKKTKKEKIVIGGKKTAVSPEFELGEKLFKGKGNCYSCHRIDKKSIGPSVTEIVKIYKEQQGDMIGFLKQQKDPIVDPENYAVMKTNFIVLSKFTEEELKAVEFYMNEVINK